MKLLPVPALKHCSPNDLSLELASSRLTAQFALFRLQSLAKKQKNLFRLPFQLINLEDSNLLPKTFGNFW